MMLQSDGGRRSPSPEIGILTREESSRPAASPPVPPPARPAAVAQRRYACRYAGGRQSRQRRYSGQVSASEQQNGRRMRTSPADNGIDTRRQSRAKGSGASRNAQGGGSAARGSQRFRRVFETAGVKTVRWCYKSAEGSLAGEINLPSSRSSLRVAE